MPAITGHPIRSSRFAVGQGLRTARFAPDRRCFCVLLGRIQPITTPNGPAYAHCNFFTMVPKRKKPTMALMQEDLPSIDPWAENAPALSRQPRRSGRNIRLTGMGSYPTSNSTYKEDTSSAGDDDKKENTSLGGGRAGVNAVMDNLKAMESNHRDTAKRQKLAVKASTVMAKEEDEDEAFKPQTLTSATQDLVRGDEVLPSPTEQNVVQVKRGKRVVEDIKVADLDNDAAQGPTEVDGEDFEVEDVNALKEAGSRPPPINSDYLPLPWKGRLGYVSVKHEDCCGPGV